MGEGPRGRHADRDRAVNLPQGAQAVGRRPALHSRRAFPPSPLARPVPVGVRLSRGMSCLRLLYVCAAAACQYAAIARFAG